MSKDNYQGEDYKIGEDYYEEFDYLGFVNGVDKERSKNSKEKGFNSSDDRIEESWYQTKSLKEAVDYARNGWDDGIEQLEPKETMAINGIPIINIGVVGSYVDIGNYIQGVPECMVKFTDVIERNKDDLTIYVQLNYLCGTSGSDAMKYCRKIVGLLNEYQRDYNIRLIGVFTSYMEIILKASHNIFVEIKKLDERFVLNSIAFAMHPGFFRRIKFRNLENKVFIQDGYGNSNDMEKLTTICKKHETSSIKWILPSLNNVGYNWDESEIIKLDRFGNSIK